MKKQQFKGFHLTRTVVKNNILRIYDDAPDEDKFDWYHKARLYAVWLTTRFKADNDYRVDLSKTIGIIAALSPMKSWEHNKICARNFLENGVSGHTNLFDGKARDILRCDGSDEAILDVLKGSKISSFYLNIKYPEDAQNVTIDRHAVSIALGGRVNQSHMNGMTNKQYEFFVHCYTIAAMERNTTPCRMQSATWVRFRKIKHLYPKL